MIGLVGSLTEAWGEVRVHKARVLLSLVGVFLAVLAMTTVTALGQILAAYPNAVVRVEGYADARGSDQSNAQLGAQRAEAVARALIAQGLAANRVTAATGGETNPVETNATAQGQAENRRTDLVVTAK